MTERRRYDCQDDAAGQARGLLEATRIRSGTTTAITYDAYGLLPTR